MKVKPKPCRPLTARQKAMLRAKAKAKANAKAKAKAKAQGQGEGQQQVTLARRGIRTRT